MLACGDDGTTYWWAKQAAALDPELGAELSGEPEGETYTLEEIRERQMNRGSSN